MVEGLGRIGFGLFGLAVLIGITWLFSNNKRAVDWKLVATGITLQIAFAALVILVPGGRDVFDALGKGFVKVLSFVNEGSGFIFGSLMDTKNYGFIFAFQVLPTIIFFSALMGVMYHLNVMQAIVRVMAWSITKVMRVSGAETTSVCASVFIGQTEAPLTVRPYIARMTQSELLPMMIGGMAHIAGGVLAAYVGMLGGGDPAQQAFYAKHLLAASIMAAPATLVVAKLLKGVIEKEQPQVVILGKQAVDDDAGQTGQMLAGLLGWSQATFASKIVLGDGDAEVTREIDGGLEAIKVKLPMVATTDLRLNEPRYASLPNIMKAKKKPIEEMTPADLGVDPAPRLTLVKVAEPPKRKAGIKVETVAELVDKLKNEAKVI